MKTPSLAIVFAVASCNLFASVACEEEISKMQKAAKNAGFDTIETPYKDFENCREIFVRDGVCARHMRAYECNKTLAEFGDPYAVYNTSRTLKSVKNGEFVEKNSELAEKIAARAIENWNAEKLFELSQMLDADDTLKEKCFKAAIAKADEKTRQVFIAEKSGNRNGKAAVEDIRKSFDELMKLENNASEQLRRVGESLMRAYADNADFDKCEEIQKILEPTIRGESRNDFFADTVVECYASKYCKRTEYSRLFDFLNRNFDKLKAQHREILAYMYENGICTQKDEARAAEIRKEYDAINKDPAGEEIWRKLYMLYTDLGRANLIKPDLQRALDFIQRGLDTPVVERNYFTTCSHDTSGGKASYYNIMGMAYLKGEGRPKDIEKGIGYLELANEATQGGCWSGYGPDFEIYNALMNGKMHERAFHYIRKYAEREGQGGYRAEYAALAYAGHCIKGVGTPVNAKLGFETIKKRLAISDNLALWETYAYLLENGIGCEANKKEAGIVRSYIAAFLSNGVINNVSEAYIPRKNVKYPLAAGAENSSAM